MAQPTISLLFKKNYLAMVRNAARGQNHLFRNFFLTIDGVERDALDNGALACGTFLSSILYLQNSTLEFLKKPRWLAFVHATVPAVEKDMQASGWYEIADVREGAVLVWDARPGQEVPVYGAMHLHIGFYVGNERAISNGSNTTLMPEEHHYTYDGARKIVRIWWHPYLDDLTGV